MKKIIQLKITLQKITPPIWRRIQVPEDFTLLQLHFLLQIVMGWTNSHLHEFQIQGERYGTLYDEDWDPESLRAEEEYTLAQVLPPRGESFGYLYDFGDSWDHEIMVEEILPRSAAMTYPRCLDGARACPPEDVGSSRGYEDFLDAVRDPEHPEHEDYLIWIGGSFDPEKFDLEAVNTALNQWELSDLVRLHLRYESQQIGPEIKPYQSIVRWSENLTGVQQTHLKELPLRRDAVSLLAYLRDHKFRGTSSYGNLPLKAVRGAAPLFVNPPELEHRVGDYVWRFQSEFNIWPIFFIHTLLEAGGLLVGGPGRLFRLTEKGHLFLAQEPPIQAHFLLETWWFHTNWMTINEMREVGNPTPGEFTYAALNLLLQSPAEQPVEFPGFADRLCLWGGLTTDSTDPVQKQETLRSWVRDHVMEPLVKFDILELRLEEKSRRYPELLSFTITKAGRDQLFALSALPYHP